MTPILVKAFLEQARDLIHAGKWLIAKRTENLETLRALGISVKEQRYILLSLAVQDFRKMDDPVKGSNECAWVFLYERNGVDLYIKLKIREFSEGNLLICVSFHVSDRGGENRLPQPFDARQ